MPHVRVIGAHLPRLDQAAIAQFIHDDVAEFKRVLLDLNARGEIYTDPAEIEERALELPEELDAELQSCALFELEVTGNDASFDPSEFHNPDTDLYGWAHVILSMDGTEVLGDDQEAPAEWKDFRAAFWVQDWDELPGRLAGPDGEVALPPFTPVPDRLWRLAPFRPVD
jgi:hypothetical protein